MDAARRRGLSLPTRILLGLALGATAGIAGNLALAPALGAEPSDAYRTLVWWADDLVKPVGDLFLRLLFMVVVPIVFCSLFLGVASLGGVGRLGRLGGLTLSWFLLTTAGAAALGLALVSAIAPGRHVPAEVAATLQREYGVAAEAKLTQARADEPFSLDFLVAIVPDNVVRVAADNKAILGLILFALLLGAAAARLPADRTRALRDVLTAVYDLCIVIVDWTMRLAPLGVACLIFHATSKLGLEVMRLVAWYLATALGGLLLYQAIVLPALAFGFAGVRPGRLLRGCRALFATAFSTSSSSATMPATIRTAVDGFGVPREIAGFVIPLGATTNMNGTALFEGVSVLFLAQVAGVELTLAQQGLVLGLTVVTAIGAAGVPGGSLPLLAVLLVQVGVPAEMLALILGVDRIVDMTRTVPNVTSDLVCTLWLARREGTALRP